MGEKGLTFLDLAPLLEMPPDDFLGLDPRARLLYAADVERAVLALEGADTAHVVAVVRELVAREAVLGRVRQRDRRVGEHVQVLALPAVRAAPAGEEEAAVLDPRRVRAGEARIALDVAASLGLCFAIRV